MRGPAHFDGTRPRGKSPEQLRTREEPTPRSITFSHEYGSGGAQVAECVAEALGFTFWDRELVELIARRSGTDPGSVRAVDERQVDLIEDVFLGSLFGSMLSGAAYRMLLTRTVSELAERGACVIVGRGASFLVRPEQALRVRVVCPLKQRVELCAARERLSLSDAERRVRDKDLKYTRFVRKLCDEDPREAVHYDVVINTCDMDITRAASLVVDAYAARFAPAHAAQSAAVSARG